MYVCVCVRASPILYAVMIPYYLCILAPLSFCETGEDKEADISRAGPSPLLTLYSILHHIRLRAPPSGLAITTIFERVSVQLRATVLDLKRGAITTTASGRNCLLSSKLWAYLHIWAQSSSTVGRRLGWEGRPGPGKLKNFSLHS